ncbi:MAG: hypothetical protein K0B87_05920 [Candidatus Syntrophosphaera sp.]|nr:hypothetical protein [Candidatus Syntrophosphaera sp.]
MRAIINYANENKKLPEAESPINLKQGETAHIMDDSAVMMEERSVSVSNRAGGAVRVARGLYLGGSQSVSRRHDEMKEIDRGQLTFTNKRIVFIGATKTKQFELNKIIRLEEYTDGFSIAYEGKEKKTIFRTSSNPSQWNLYFQLQNKLNRGEELPQYETNISFEQ